MKDIIVDTKAKLTRFHAVKAKIEERICIVREVIHEITTIVKANSGSYLNSVLLSQED